MKIEQTLRHIIQGMKALKVILKCSIEIVDSFLLIDCNQVSISDEGLAVEPHGVSKTSKSAGNTFNCYIVHLLPPTGE
nr:hypothetical protein BN444_00386 [Xanthomonas translucens pv. translucens DSM 18974]